MRDLRGRRDAELQLILDQVSPRHRTIATQPLRFKAFGPSKVTTPE
jgi:hypothetical protein